MKLRKLIFFLMSVLVAYVLISYASGGGKINYLQTVGSLITEKFNSNKNQSKLIIPSKKLMPSSLKDELFFNNHWESDRGYFLLVKNTLATKVSPSATAEEFKNLNRTERVRILYENVQQVTIDGEDRKWVFVATEIGKTYLGWMFKDQLASKNDFKSYSPYETWEYHYKQGEIKSHIIIEKNGAFTLKWKASGQGLFLRGEDKGNLYHFEDIIWAKKENQDFLYNFFLIDSTNQLQHEFRFRNDPINPAIYTMPKQEGD